jgi:hypothetical protein
VKGRRTYEALQRFASPIVPKRLAIMHLTEQMEWPTDSPVASNAAGAPVKLHDEPEPSALRFRGDKDALDLCDHRYETGNGNWFRHKIDFSESYEKGDIEIIIEVAARGCSSNYHLVFFAVPSRDVKFKIRTSQMMNIHSPAACPDRDESGMCGITELVQGPKGAPIPSFVRLERAKNRHDIRRQICASTPNVVLNVSSSIPKGKLRPLGLVGASENRSSIAGLVEGGSESLKSFSGVVCADVGNSLGHAEFVKLKTIRVFLNDLLVWYVFEEDSDPFFKLSGVILSTR